MALKFCQRFNPISISLSPNTEKDDIWLAFKLIFQPWKWKRGAGIAQLEQRFREYLGAKYIFSFNSARTCLMAILYSLGLAQRSEVLVQAFTCNAAVNPILWTGLEPVYVDCDLQTFNIDKTDLARKITSKSKALIVQHTFGLPAEMQELSEIAADNNLILIEDCAHSLGAEYKGKKAGTFGKTAFFSFSRDKVISCVYGGAAATNDDELADKLKEYQEKIGYPSYFWIFQQLLHPILLNWLILPTYSFLGLGKILLIVFQLLHILSKAVHWKEKRGAKPAYFPKRLPNCLAELALQQLNKLDKFYYHRKELFDFYCQELAETLFKFPPFFPKQSFLRLTLRHPEAHAIIRQAWKKNILLGDWYNSPVAPLDTELPKVHYKGASCPNAELLSKTTFNLPTSITISKGQAQKIVDFLKSYENSPSRK